MSKKDYYISLSDYANIINHSAIDTLYIVSNPSNRKFVSINNNQVFISSRILSSYDGDNTPSIEHNTVSDNNIDIIRSLQDKIDLLESTISAQQSTIQDKDNTIADFANRFADLATQAQLISLQSQVLQANNNIIDTNRSKPNLFDRLLHRTKKQ